MRIYYFRLRRMPQSVSIREFKSSDGNEVAHLYYLAHHAYETPPILKEVEYHYTNMNLQRDMSDIHKNYIEKDGCNFWVIETKKCTDDDTG